ncbi:hypothetical protein LZL87_007985 [Fusarium oxysporum]|nr:hypothetical protein LZL87_007985 [Fusarium oxysporum]
MDSPSLGNWLAANSTDRVGLVIKFLRSLIVVSSDAKHRHDPIRRGFERSGRNGDNFMIWTYTLWTKHVQSCWSNAGPALNEYSILVIDLDPFMTMECAMALVATTHSAMDTAIDSMTRLVTVSCTNIDYAFERLSQHFGLAPPMTFRFYDTSTQDTQAGDQKTIYCESASKLAERFRERIEDVEGKHIVLVYNSVAAANALQIDESWKTWTLAEPSKQRAAVQSIFDGLVESNVIVTIPDRFHPPMPLSGYHHVHKVVQPKVRRTSFDFSVGQTTSFAQLLSFQERVELRSTFRRLKGRPLSATLYDVWNRSLGAFMTLVASLGARVDAAATVQCFVPEGVFTTYLTMEYRLKTHGILKWNTDERLTLGLEHREFAIFREVLPFVEYDYRLAYLVAQKSQSGSHNVLQTKIQLAAVINSGGISMFDFQASLPQSLDTLQEIISACTGYSHFENIAPEGRIQFPGKLSLTVDRSGCIKARDSWCDMSSALVECGIQTTQKEYGDESILSESECHEIQSHLFRAYLSQLTSCCRDRVNKDNLEFLDISSKRTINGLLGAGDYTIDNDKIPDNAPAFGVYHSLRRYDDGELNFKDWTFIPSKIVNDWVWEFRERVGDPTFGIESMLRIDGAPRRNYDGVSNEVWEVPDW